MPTMADPPVLLVRRTNAGLTRRSVHVVPVPEGGVPAVLVALCGEEFGPGEAETVKLGVGMPCEWCLARRVSPQAPWVSVRRSVRAPRPGRCQAVTVSAAQSRSPVRGS